MGQALCGKENGSHSKGTFERKLTIAVYKEFHPCPSLRVRMGPKYIIVDSGLIL